MSGKKQYKGCSAGHREMSVRRPKEILWADRVFHEERKNFSFFYENKWTNII
jgi:hypothetical protein